MSQLVLPDGQPFRLCLEAGKSDSTLVLTYAEFGGRPRENQSGGTDHGTANAHFVLGGRVKGGLYGQHPQLDRLDGNGNLAVAVDFRNSMPLFWRAGGACRRRRCWAADLRHFR